MYGAAIDITMWVDERVTKCVWMTAGILTYKLCDREMDCEHCLLHRALSENSSARGSKAHGANYKITK